MSIAKHIIDVFEGERIPLNERDSRYYYYEIRHMMKNGSQQQ